MEDNYWKCWNCEKNHANCGHHIMGRGHDEGCEKSPFNYAPLENHECHLPIHGRLSTEDSRKKLLEKTASFLISSGYTITDLDREFVQKYKKYYNKEIYEMVI